MHPVLFSRLMDRRSRGERVRLIDIGTRRTRTTSFADHYLEFRPHSDQLIVNAVMNALVQRRLYDEAFVASHCAFRKDSTPADLPGQAITFDEFAQGIAPYSLQSAAEQSGVSLDDLEL